MDNGLVLSVDSVLEATLKNSNASFIKISRKEFLSIQKRFIRMRSMVYKSEELELACGESEVMYHSLLYKGQQQANAIQCCKYDFPCPVRSFGR